MRILVSNDDGIQSQGILDLAAGLQSVGEVIVVAPDMERSATGHAITMHQPLRIREVKLPGLDLEAYAVDGTPADCVKLAIDEIMDKKPDFVFTGINRGANLGSDVLYSGTVSAAIEGRLMGVTSVAMSLIYDDVMDFKYSAKVAAQICKILSENPLNPEYLLNVNIPNVSEELIQGMQITRLGHRRWAKNYEKRQDPRGRTYYWLAGEIIDEPMPSGTDIDAVNRNYVSITPLHYDLTGYNIIEELKRWGFDQ